MFKLFSKSSNTKEMSAAEAVAAFDRIVLLDIRDAGELRQSGTARGAVHIPLSTLSFRADPRRPEHEARLATDATICVFCAAGGRAASAKRMLEAMGYSDVHNIGGLRHWAQAGGEVVSS